MKSISKLEFDFPVPRTHCGIVAGNGNAGIMVWGKENLNITVNRADFWDHRGGETVVEGTTYKKAIESVDPLNGEAVERAFLRLKWPEDVFKPQRVPMGRFEFVPASGIKLEKLSLEYKSGIITVTASNGKTLSILMSMKENLVILNDPSGIIASVKTVPSWDFEKSRKWLSKYACKAPQKSSGKDYEAWMQSCPADPSLAAVCKDCGKGLKIISLELGANDEEALKNALELIDEAKSRASKIVSETGKWWKEYWKDCPQIELPDEFFNKFYKYCLYKFAGSTSPDSVKPVAAGLQGPWIEEYHNAQWSGDYHFNVNVQQVYTLALQTGKLKHLMPLFDMLESEQFMANMRHNAKTLLGIDDGLLLTHAVDDKGFQCGWLMAGSILDQACGAWTALLYWLYYKQTGDKEFLAKRAVPFMAGILRVYEAMLEERNGKLSIPLAISAEYGCRNPGGQKAGRDPSYQLAAIHMLLDALGESCKVLNIPERPFWSEMRSKVPNFTVAENLDPHLQMEKHIAIWEGQDLDTCHRHHSHLGGVYPFDSFGGKLNAEEEEILNNSIDRWILMGMGQWSEWCIPWAAILQARLGFNEAPSVLLEMWRHIFVNEGLTTVYLPRFRGLIAHRRHDMVKPKEDSEVMQIDGTMGSASALLEMLAHTHSGTTRVLGGIPERWKDLSFKDVRTTAGLCVSGEKRKGRMEKLEISSPVPAKLKLIVQGETSMNLIRNGQPVKVSFPFEADLAAGEKLDFVC